MGSTGDRSLTHWRAWRRATVLCCLLATLAGPAQAVKLVTGDQYAPWVDDSMPEHGVATEMVRDIFASIGQKHVEIEVRPWRRGLFDAGRGLYDATFPYGRTPTREHDFLYSEPLFKVRHVFFSKVEAPALTSVEGLKGRTVCRPQGYAMEVLLQLARDVRFTVEQPSNIGSCFRMLALGRVDLVFTSEFVGLRAIEDLDILKPDEIKAEVLAEIADEITVHLIAPKVKPGSAELIERFNQGLREYERKGFKRDLFVQRFGRPGE